MALRQGERHFYLHGPFTADLTPNSRTYVEVRELTPPIALGEVAPVSAMQAEGTPPKGEHMTVTALFADINCRSS
jgi:hypothetical protein